MSTKDKRWQYQCYGRMESDIVEGMSTALGGPHMLAMSILSDSQELMNIASGVSEQEARARLLNEARQYVNCAKYVISKLRDAEAMK